MVRLGNDRLMSSAEGVPLIAQRSKYPLLRYLLATSLFAESKAHCAKDHSVAAAVASPIVCHEVIYEDMQGAACAKQGVLCDGAQAG